MRRRPAADVAALGGNRVNLRRDHVAGGAFVLAGALVLAVSADLPFGTMASPGAGMLPKLIVGFLMAFGAVLVRARGRQPASRHHRLDRCPACRARRCRRCRWPSRLYTTLGFVCTIGCAAVRADIPGGAEADLLVSAAFSIGVTVLAYTLFGMLLKTPLPRGIMGF